MVIIILTILWSYDHRCHHHDHLDHHGYRHHHHHCQFPARLPWIYIMMMIIITLMIMTIIITITVIIMIITMITTQIAHQPTGGESSRDWNGKAAAWVLKKGEYWNINISIHVLSSLLLFDDYEYSRRMNIVIILFHFIVWQLLVVWKLSDCQKLDVN